ncbi:DNA repair ATPase [Yinghuangia sp. KLBMP8922]|uniref:DNA repair ATPase n=1 Tax=Yinghuangia soli TaxID=2908204 RepID=A0AA41Q761_9ACTN|nr:DNA repair ATPase [Yinghuangia soli]
MADGTEGRDGQRWEQAAGPAAGRPGRAAREVPGAPAALVAAARSGPPTEGSPAESAEDPAEGEPQGTGDHEVLRARLAGQAAELARRADRLNRLRIEAFGATGLRLLGTARLRTAEDTELRDLVRVGGHLLAGGNPGSPGNAVDLGAPAPAGGAADGPAAGRTFSVHRPDPAAAGGGPGFTATGLDTVPELFGHPDAARDLDALFRYYRGARLLHLRHVDGLLLAVFQAGPRADDVRVLRWRLGADGTPAYLDARGDRDHTYPPPYDFAWTETTREDHRPGRHPHVSVADGAVFVSTCGGELTVKTADDTETPAGTVHREPVDEPLQSLADADIHYARVGTLVLLRIRPYKEDTWRHLVHATTTATAVRLDAIGQAACRLPGDEGIVFPGGFHLGTGLHKTFDTDTRGMGLQRVLRSPNGEDTLYVFHRPEDGRTLLQSYNSIAKTTAAPLTGRGFTTLDDGRLVILRGDPEPVRSHPVQVWASPYTSDTYDAARPAPGGPLGRIGNADLVHGIADTLAVVRLAEGTTATAAGYQALLDAAARVADRCHWLADDGLGGLHEPLDALRATAAQILAEFRAGQELADAAARSVDDAAARIAALVRRTRNDVPHSADGWIRQLAALRDAQGSLAPLRSLRELRPADHDRITALHTALGDDLAAAGRRATAFLGGPDAFTAPRAEADDLARQAAAATSVADGTPITARLDELADGLHLVASVVTDLDDADATVRTGVLARITDVHSALARARALLAARLRSLAEEEGRAESAAQYALLAQNITAGLAAADTPESCDEQLARILLRIEDLGIRFPDFDDLRRDLAAKRDETENAFAARRQALVDERARHTARLADSAHRILASIRRRAAALRSSTEITAYFAADPTVAKIHRTAAELRTLGDYVAAEELDGRLKAARQEAARTLRDRADLSGDGGATVRLGRHHFAVTTRTPTLTLVPHAGHMAFALTGTDYRRPVTDPAFTATAPLWDRTLPSESPAVYRAEYLAARLMAAHTLDTLAAADLPALLHQAVEDAPDEGYERGVHDHDAHAILRTLLRLHADAGLLRYPAADRAAAQLFWVHGTDDEARRQWTWRARSLGRARAAFGAGPEMAALGQELALLIGAFAAENTPAGDAAPDPERAAEYLLEELARSTRDPGGFVAAAAARTLVDKFRHAVGTDAYDEDLRRVTGLPARQQLVRAWLGSYRATAGEAADPGDLAEAVALELCPDLPRYPGTADTRAAVPGLLGDHPRIERGTLPLRLDEFLPRLAEFRTRQAPAFRAYQGLRRRVIAAEHTRLRLDDHRPSVVTTFVRNRLVDQVYLPLVGDNLAKQIGAAGRTKRTDNHGLLLLVSPPGYGKTTLVEYVAERLGMLLVRIDGPALGRGATSLDPAEAPDATSRREIEKANFALAAADNVLLYLDDIQHCSPELLQKFLPLCDAQRRIAGVRDGEAHTYDLRGKRFAVVMAGNPYTEQGRRFRVPDMLANRADVWNLGDVVGGRQDAFALSFVENALTANTVLAPLAERGTADLDLLLQQAAAPAGTAPVRPDRLEHAYAPAELDRITAVLRHLLAARATVLTVNRAYMESAARTDASRTEPAFRLQGSYRNMNRIAERITPAMDPAELDALVTGHYTAEAQTLGADTEANLLKLAELRGLLTGPEAARWTAVKQAWANRVAPGPGLA